jgi:hypothetical protein
MRYEITYRLYEDIVLSEFITINVLANQLETAYNEAYRRSMEIKAFLGLNNCVGRTVRVTGVRQIIMPNERP